MAFCKICTCGEKIVFERIMSFPDYCPSCGRKLVDFQTYKEEDPTVAKLMENSTVSETPEMINGDSSSKGETHRKKYTLELSNGKKIEIPDEGGIVGRTEIGAEELAEFPSVSRQHLRVTPRRNVGVIVEDISKYGTLVDGQRIVKNSPVRVAEGSKFTLCNVEAILTVKEVND